MKTLLFTHPPSPAPYMIPHPPQFISPPHDPPPFVPPPNLPMPADNAKWISLLRMIAQSQQPTSFNNINMVKFSNLNKFTGKSQDVDSYVKTIESHISAALGTFTNDFQMTTYFASWLGSGIPEKWYQVSGNFNPQFCMIILLLCKPSLTILGTPTLLKLHTVNSGHSGRLVWHQLM